MFSNAQETDFLWLNFYLQLCHCQNAKHGSAEIVAGHVHIPHLLWTGIDNCWRVLSGMASRWHPRIPCRASARPLVGLYSCGEGPLIPLKPIKKPFAISACSCRWRLLWWGKEEGIGTHISDWWFPIQAPLHCMYKFDESAALVIENTLVGFALHPNPTNLIWQNRIDEDGAAGEAEHHRFWGWHKVHLQNNSLKKQITGCADSDPALPIGCLRCGLHWRLCALLSAEHILLHHFTFHCQFVLLMDSMKLAKFLLFYSAPLHAGRWCFLLLRKSGWHPLCDWSESC